MENWNDLIERVKDMKVGENIVFNISSGIYNLTKTEDVPSEDGKKYQDEELYSVAMARKKQLLGGLKKTESPEDYEECEEILHHISRAEYKRGKADGFALSEVSD